ncbi:MAG: TolC family protein [Bacteroidia bacterium]
MPGKKNTSKGKRFTLVLLAFLIINSIEIYAQDSMSLQQCIAYAWENNIQLSRSELDLQQKENSFQQTRYSRLPSLNANASQNYNFGRTVDPSTNQFANQQSRNNGFSLSTNVLLFNGLQMMNEVRQAKWSQDASTHSLQKAKDDAALTIANQYLQILLLTERQKQLQNQLKTSQDSRNRTKTLFDAGAVAQVKMLEAEAQLASDESLLIDIENQLTTAYLNLKQYMNYDISKPLKIQTVNFTGQLNQYTETELNKVFTERLQNLPGVQSAKSSRESALYGLKSQQGNMSPKVYANASLQSFYSSLAQQFGDATPAGIQQIGYNGADSSPVYAPRYNYSMQPVSFDEQVNNNFGQSLGFTLSIPIFNGLQNKYAIQNARINLQNAQLTLTEAETQARNDIYTAFEGMRLSQKKLMATQSKFTAQEALFKQSELSFNAGAMSFYDFNAVRNSFSSAQSEVLQARFEYIFQTKVFEYYMGKPVSF